MTRIFVPSTGQDDWRSLLADPSRHWVPTKSAFECAVSWEGACRSPRGLPESIANALDSHESTANAELVLAIPEFQVDLPGGGHPSQNDVWALLRAGADTVSLSVEAKSGEPLDRLVGEWLADAPAASGKPKRLEFLRECLGLSGVDLAGLRYQLLHRAASALVQADRFGARIAVLLIQSFGGHSDNKSREDYRRFADAMDCPPAFNAAVGVGRPTKLPVLIGWAEDAPASEGVSAQAPRTEDLVQRITRDPAVMGGRPCIRGIRVTVGTIVGLLAAGQTHKQILRAYPYLEADDIRAALAYAAQRTDEVERPLP